MLPLERKRDVPAIADDVDHQGIGYRFFDPLHSQKMIRRTVSPPFHSLLAAHGIHDDAQKIAPISAVRHDFFFDLDRIQSGFCEEAAVFPGLQQRSLVAVHPQITKARFQQIEHLRFRPVHDKISSRQQHVVKQGRARARTPQHENRRLAARTRPRGFV